MTQTTLPGEARPYVLEAGTGRADLLLGQVFRTLVSGAESRGALGFVSMAGPKGAPIPMHRHAHAHDVFYCERGAIQVWFDGASRVLFTPAMWPASRRARFTPTRSCARAAGRSGRSRRAAGSASSPSSASPTTAGVSALRPLPAAVREVRPGRAGIRHHLRTRRTLPRGHRRPRRPSARRTRAVCPEGGRGRALSAARNREPAADHRRRVRRRIRIRARRGPARRGAVRSAPRRHAILYVLDGRLDVTVDGVAYSAAPGDCARSPPAPSTATH